MNYRSDNGFSHYNALNLKYAANNLWNKGLGVTMNYTWSHALDNLSSTFSDSIGGLASGFYALGYLDEFNPRLNFGNSDYDIRHRFVLGGTWEPPWMKHAANPVAREVLGGWGLGSILNIRSGMPFSIYDCSNNVNGNCPLWIPSAPVAMSGSAVATSGADLFNYIALPTSNGNVVNVGDSLAIPTCTGLYHQGCTYSISGLPYPERNQFVGPNYWNLDMNFFKNFRLTERFQLQLRGEMYNILNHHNQYVTYENLDVSGLATPYIQTEKGGYLGVAGLADERRNIQFGLKLTF